MAHDAWSHPLDHPQEPFSRTPPPGTSSHPLIAATDDDASAVGSSAHTSSCNSADINPIRWECWASRPATQAVDAHAPAMSTSAGVYSSAPIGVPP